MMRISVIIPCLNEEKTLATCIHVAQQALRDLNMPGEIIVADNGSIDTSVKIAEGNNARVVHVQKKGYGNALQAGILSARGEYVVIADADLSYDFAEMPKFISKLEQGFDLVVGNRFSGTIKPTAMGFMKRYVGNPVLSGIGRFLYGNVCGDFHCGLRAARREELLSLTLQTPGMEYASEMIIRAYQKKLKIGEVPITLHPDGRGHISHLRPVRDGLRHLYILFSYLFK
jgi:glycosyltransferase involved in cell wall biosynthesis